jgi:hypothetical protein
MTSISRHQRIALQPDRGGKDRPVLLGKRVRLSGTAGEGCAAARQAAPSQPRPARLLRPSITSQCPSSGAWMLKLRSGECITGSLRLPTRKV